jgi:hypothetical protein
MFRIRRWVIGKNKRVVWSEPRLPPYVKINPEATPPGPDEVVLQPGDLSMAQAAQEFLMSDEGEEEEEPGPTPAAP